MFWLTLFVLFCAAVYTLRSVLLPFVTGIVIGYLLDPFASRFEKWGMNRTLATFLVLFLVAIIALPALALLISVIDEQLGRFINVVPQYIGTFLRKIEPFINELHERFPNLEPEKIREYMRNNLANTLKLAGNVLRGIVTSSFAIFNLISLLLITPVVAFYMLRDWDMFIAKVDSLLPRKSKASIREQAHQIDRTLAGFIRGQLSVCVILGTYYSFGLYLVGRFNPYTGEIQVNDAEGTSSVSVRNIQNMALDLILVPQISPVTVTLVYNNRTYVTEIELSLASGMVQNYTATISEDTLDAALTVEDDGAAEWEVENNEISSGNN